MPLNSSQVLSIVIPTKNRILYAKSCIKSILRNSEADFQLVVQDNSDSRDLQMFCHGIGDPRLDYEYIDTPLSMIENFNRGIERAQGAYVLLIGDDDGVNPEILDAAIWARDNNIDAITPGKLCSYLWQTNATHSTLLTKIKGAQLLIPQFTGQCRYVDVRAERLALLKNGGIYYQDYALPKLYYGLVKRERLLEVRALVGSYFGGLSPDVFIAICLADVVTRVVRLDYPLTIPGACPGSGSTSRLEGRFGGRFEDAIIFQQRRNYKWNEMVPRVYIPEAVWLDSEIAACNACRNGNLIDKIDFGRFAAFSIYANFPLAKVILREFFRTAVFRGESQSRALCALLMGMVFGPTKALVIRIWNRMKLTMGIKDVCEVHELADMEDATQALSNYLRARKLSFQRSVGSLQESEG